MLLFCNKNIIIFLKSIQEKIKSRRLELGLSLEDVAKELNVNKTTVMRYESRSIEKMPIDVIPPLARILKCSPEYLMGWDEDNLTEVKIEFNDYFPLHYSTNLSAGTLDELLDSEPDAVVYVPIVFQMKRKRLHAFKVNGTSMDNVFPDGSIVISESVTAIDSLKDGAIVVVWVNGTATVKRLYIGEHQITLMPDSTDKSHQPILVDTDINTVTVIGRVIWHMNPDDISKTY